MILGLKSIRFPISYVQLAVKIAASQGRNIEELLRDELMVELESLCDPQALIDGVQMARVLDIVYDFVKLFPDGQQQFVSYFPLTIHGYVGLVAMTAETIQESLALVEQYFYQINPAVELTSSIQDGVYKLELNSVANLGENNNALMSELVICGIHSILEYSTLPLDKVSATISHNELVLLDLPSLYSECSITKGCTENTISFPASLLASEMVTANSATSTHIQKELEQRKLRLDRSHKLSYKICLLLRKKIKENKSVDRNDIAHTLGLSSRSLSRRLSEEGTSFKQIHNTCRLELAESFLAESDQNICQISYALGFRSEASFSRYFKQQTGVSPIQFRSSL